MMAPNPLLTPPRVTRLAPSPTGALHLGNARTFVVNWMLARANGWRIILRIEDLDSPRVKPGAAAQAIEDLRWLGLDWDDGPLDQLSDMQPYHAAVSQLADRGLVYACTCSRREIAGAQSAPHAGEHELRYPGTCRPPQPRYGMAEVVNGVEPPLALRVRVPDEPLTVLDAFAGEQMFDVQRTVGDFAVTNMAGQPTYQLAVVVDDARQGVTDVVRADDLLPSAARQLWLYRLLDLTPLPRHWHLPLIVGSDGRRLAKRHGDTRLAQYREQGVPPEAVLGLLARWTGCAPRREPISLEHLKQRFDIQRLPREAVTFTTEDHTWLLQQR